MKPDNQPNTLTVSLSRNCPTTRTPCGDTSCRRQCQLRPAAAD